MVGKYSIVSFNVKTIHPGGFYVEDIQNGLLKLSGIGRMVDPREVHEINYEDLKTEELIQIHHQLSVLEGVFLVEIRRRATMNKNLKLDSPYFFDHFDVKKKIGK